MIVYANNTFESESPLDTPRPLKRNISLRFPIVTTTSGSEASSDLRSPALGKPLISQRHYRVASGQVSAPPNATLRRPGLTPLTIGNERIRSNSESILQASQNIRNKRMGMVSRKNSELGTLNEAQSQRNSSHFRGFSQGAVFRDSRDGRNVSRVEGLKATEVMETGQASGTFVHRLSSLPEHKSESPSMSTSFIESAKGVLYSLHQVHPHVSTLLIVLKIKRASSSKLESAYSQASSNLKMLDLSIHAFGQGANDDVVRQNAIYQIGRRCRVCLITYQDVGNLLFYNTSPLVVHGDQRYLRTWLLFIFGNLVEARNACLTLGLNIKDKELRNQATIDPAIQERYQDAAQRQSLAPSITPTKERPYPTRRVQNENTSKTIRTYGHVPTNTHPTVPLYVNGRSRSNSQTNTSSISNASSIVNTPRSGETFLVPETPLVPAGSDRIRSLEDTSAESEILFERIYHDFKQSIELGLQVVPKVCRHFRHSLEIARSRYADSDTKDTWKRLIGHCQNYLDECETLKRRMGNVRINDPESNFDKYWMSCGKYTNFFIRLVDEVKHANNHKLMGPEISRALHPVYKSVKVTALNVQNSPWAWIFNHDSPPKRSGQTKNSRASEDRSHNRSGKSITISHKHSQTGSGSSSSQYGSSVPMTPIPATPLSAALGPAAQATVPNTPSNIPINFFERLEAYKNSLQSNQYNRH